MAERLQLHLDRENLPTGAADLVRTAQKALAEAANVVEESVTGQLNGDLHDEG